MYDMCCHNGGGGEVLLNVKKTKSNTVLGKCMEFLLTILIEPKFNFHTRLNIVILNL